MGNLQRRDLKDLVRSCVQCGLCLPHCATWLATGNEVQSPRGRLMLLEAVLEENEPAAPEDFMAAFDQCIGCRTCEAMCPSGVPFTLLEFGQRMAASTYPGPASAAPLLRHLDSPNILKGLRLAGDFGRTGLQLFGGNQWRRKLEGKPMALGRLARLLGSMPHSPENNRHLAQLLDGLIEKKGPVPTREQSRGTVQGLPENQTIAFFHGCASAHLLPGTSSRMREILHWSGCRLIEPKNQHCCGALADHTGRLGTASAQDRAFNQTFSELAEGTAILVEAAGCSHHLKKNPDRRPGIVTDAVVFLAGLDLPKLGAVPLKVAYHDPCHALHGQGIKDEPRKLLGKIPGLQLLEPIEQEVCCGSGGAWGLRYPDLSGELARRKARNLVDCGAELVVTSNPGCLGQIADGLALEAPDLPIIPLSDLIWYGIYAGGGINRV